MMIYENESISFRIEDKKCLLAEGNNIYELSGNPYEPCVYIEGNGISKTIRGETYFPDVNNTKEVWERFCMEILNKINEQED